ncbi:MAG: hypothetical protein A2287_01655 [Candidatus Melainabacteria bacterium RIFOXYA12_FULL_32_12]|nr:MAG: hypothetical protein A2255_10750 [Candidatus Melainabacteria bacterium RIFOXYA2_FULL_32_9]OGI27214.1 MAG: hypothetical protein A2287_01655 [Candidatus Melainabacteria bacterium RIFOXYA12_FULL_32_12]
MNDLKGPSLSEIKQFIKDKIWVDFHTVNDKVFKGQIIWFDDSAFHINLENGQAITILRIAIVYYGKSQS